MSPLIPGEHPGRLLGVRTLDVVRQPRVVDGATCIAACAAALLALDQVHKSGLVSGYAASSLAVGLASSALLLRRTAPTLVMVAALLSTLASDDATLLIFAAYSLGSYGKRSRWAGVAVGGLLYLLTRTWVEPLPPEASAMAYDAVVKIGFPAALGELMRRRREVAWLLQRRLVAAEHAVDQATRQAVLDERTRLAFDIHDGLGHRATVLIFQAQALRSTPGMPEPASALASTVEEGARGMLQDMRSILDVLRDATDPSEQGGPPYAQFAASLVSNLSAAGIDVSFRQTGEARPLPAGADGILRSCGREALTNAVKHGHGAPISLHLAFTSHEVCLEVCNGPGIASSLSRLPGGLGMVSMREQVARSGGRIQAGPTDDGGFRVHVALPAPHSTDEEH
ncbi:sensor histidine kinase [Streptomyces sp. NPDC002536]